MHLSEKAYLWELPLYDGHRLVIGAIIDDDDFQRRKGLVLSADDSLANEAGSVVGWDDNANREGP